MPISLSCTSCQRALRVKDELAGKQILCPDCKTKLTVPGGDMPPPLPEPAPEVGLAYEKPADDPYGARAELPPPEREEHVDDQPAPQHAPTKPDKEFGSVNAGVGGGILMMAIAVVWFVVGWFFDWYFCYPPILFVVGLIAFIKGLVNKE